jgi:glycosyltransferase involved in cell wall biosynthesis
MKILYAHTALPSYIRVKKNIEAFISLGHEVFFFGAQRKGSAKFEEGKKTESLQVEVYSKEMPHGAMSVFSLIGYICQLRKVILRQRPECVVVTNEELVLACSFLPKNRPIIILDAIDALDIRRKSNKVVAWILHKIVQNLRRKSTFIVEVEEFRATRWPEYYSKTIVLRNTPQYISISNYTSGIILDDKLKNLPETYIYASGSLNSGINGIESLIEAVRKIHGMRVVIAGFLPKVTLRELIERNQDIATFVGVVTHQESIYIASQAVAMFAHYSPEILNFVLAAPNKVYEAFMLGKPLLINAECKISEFCEERDFGYLSAYGDANELDAKIRLIQDDICSGKFQSDSIRGQFKNEYDWNIELQKWKKILK